MVRCIDCGFCGYYINLLDGLKCREMSADIREAFRQGIERNPLSQAPGTGHWNCIKCLLDTNVDWKNSTIESPEKFRESLIENRVCKKFFEYHAGFLPHEHHELKDSQFSLHLKQWNTWIAILALILSIISIIIAILLK